MIESLKMPDAQSEILEKLSAKGDIGLGFENILKETGRSRGIVNKHLRELYKHGMVERKPGYGRQNYRISKKGNQLLDTKEEIYIISRTTKLLQKEIIPDPEFIVDPPSHPRGIFPFNVSVYLDKDTESRLKRREGSEIESRKKKMKFTNISSVKNEVQKRFLNQLTYNLTSYYDTWLAARLEHAIEYWTDHKISQLPPKERRKYVYSLHNYHPGKDISKMTENELAKHKRLKKFVEDDERYYLNVKFPRETDVWYNTLEEFLNFEIACVVRISSKRLKEEAENIRKRLLKWLLDDEEKCYHTAITIDNHPIMRIVLTPEEYETYSQTKTNKQRQKFIQQLKIKYGVVHASQSVHGNC